MDDVTLNRTYGRGGWLCHEKQMRHDSGVLSIPIGATLVYLRFSGVSPKIYVKYVMEYENSKRDFRLAKKQAYQQLMTSGEFK